MTEFKADCTINLHVEARGKPARTAWSCSVMHGKHGRLVLARKFMGEAPREEAELEALLFSLRQTERLLQEKVELCASFSLEGKVAGKGAVGASPGLKSRRGEIVKAWGGFRLRRVSRMKATELAVLRESVEKACQRKQKRDG
jgi:hypothetical protein